MIPQVASAGKAYYTPDEALSMRLLPVGRTVLYRLLAEGRIPARRIGKKYIIPRAALERWLADTQLMNLEN